jgi:hypothetical protein
LSVWDTSWRPNFDKLAFLVEDENELADPHGIPFFHYKRLRILSSKNRKHVFLGHAAMEFGS